MSYTTRIYIRLMLATYGLSKTLGYSLSTSVKTNTDRKQNIRQKNIDFSRAKRQIQFNKNRNDTLLCIYPTWTHDSSRWCMTSYIYVELIVEGLFAIHQDRSNFLLFYSSSNRTRGMFQYWTQTDRAVSLLTRRKNIPSWFGFANDNTWTHLFKKKEKICLSK